MKEVAETNKINIREARPLLNRLSEEVVKNDSYVIITVRDQPKSMLIKYDEDLAKSIDGRNRNRKRNNGEEFVYGMSNWLSRNKPVITDEDITSKLDEIAYA